MNVSHHAHNSNLKHNLILPSVVSNRLPPMHRTNDEQLGHKVSCNVSHSGFDCHD